MGKASRLRKERQNGEAAKGHSSPRKGKDDQISMSVKDETLCKSREVDKVRMTAIKSLKEERKGGNKTKGNTKKVEADSRKDITGLQQQLSDGVKQYSDSVRQFKVKENFLNEQNEMPQKEEDSGRHSLEMQNQGVEAFLSENVRLKKQLEEKEEQRSEFELLCSEFEKKYRQLEEMHLELLKDTEEQEKTILSLQTENASVGNENSFFLQRFNEETKKSQDISEIFLKSDQRVLYLECQSLGWKTELASAKSGYDEIAAQLDKVKEDMNKLSNDSQQIKEEKEALQQNLMLQLSIKKELEEELMSTHSSFAELKECVSRGEQQIAMLQSQFLDVTEEKNNKIFDIQRELCDMVIQLANLQDQVLSIAEGKRFLEDKNTETERKMLVSEEEQVQLNGRIGELERALEFIYKDLESLRATTVAKECQLAELQFQLSDPGEEGRYLEEENNSLRIELDKCRMASKQTVQDSDKIRELGSSLESVNKDLESRDIQLQQLIAERQHLQPHVYANREPKGVHANEKANNAQEKQQPKQGSGNLECQSLGWLAELASAMSAYDEVAGRLDKIKEDMNELSNDSQQIKGEKEALHQNLMLQISIKKELEEELMSTKSSFEELKECGSRGEQQIAMLQSQLSDVAEENNSQIFDIQSELCAMVIQLANVQDQLLSTAEEKRFIEEKATETERKMLASEELDHLMGRIGELEGAFDFVNKDLESSRTMTVATECQLSELQLQLSDLGEEKRCLQEENNSLRPIELNKCRMASEQIVQPSEKTRELEISLESFNEDIESRDIQLQQLMPERQQSQPHVHAKGEPQGVHANEKPNYAHEKQPPKHGSGNRKSRSDCVRYLRILPR